MPTYDYRCPQCGKFTITQGIKEKALEKCPTCGALVHRLIGKNVNIIYKCGGFYSTDTRSPSGTANNGAEAQTTEPIPSDAKPESSAADKTEAKTEPNIGAKAVNE